MLGSIRQFRAPWCVVRAGGEALPAAESDCGIPFCLGVASSGNSTLDILAAREDAARRRTIDDLRPFIYD